MEGLSSPGLLSFPVSAVVFTVYGTWLRRHDEHSTPAPLNLRRECGPRNYGYALSGPARMPKLAPENYEEDAQRGVLLLLKLSSHAPPNPAREVQ